jgi:hypothetical protein
MEKTESVRLEEERSKCHARLSTASTDKSRQRAHFDLASCEARLGRTKEAITALRESIACGLDVTYAEELQKSPAFETLWELPGFHLVIAALEGRPDMKKISYADGERERCAAEALLCGLCNEPLREPLQHSFCGFVFCSACLTPQATCPQCQVSMPPETVSKFLYRMVLNKLDALKVHCPRCCKTVERGSLDAHVQQCAVLCSHGCRQKILPSALEEHTRVCTAVEVVCSAADLTCAWKGAREKLPGHVGKCPFVKNQKIYREIIALKDELRAQKTAFEEANRALADDNRELRVRVARLEGTENATK